MVDIRGFDARIAAGHGEEIVDLNNRPRAWDGVRQMVDHKRKIEGMTVGGQLQQDDVDGKPTASYKARQH